MFDFSTFPNLETPRLILRQATLEDTEEIFSYLSDAEVMKYDDPSTPIQELAEAVSAIEKSRQSFTDRQSIPWSIVLKEENRVIGSFSFYFPDRRYYSVDLGYTVARPYWRRGIASEAVHVLIQFAFETLGVHRINVDTRIDNIASVRLVEKLGFHHEGLRRECIRNEDGSYQSWALYGMLENEYRHAV